MAHLADLGHRKIAHLAGPDHLSTTVSRIRGLIDACRDHDLDEPEIVRGSGFTVPGGREACSRLLGSTREVSAIVAGNDMMALGAFDVLEEAGLRCPDDVSVVGHNDMPFMSRVDPPLTTVSIPQKEIGATAAAMLLELRAGRNLNQPRRLVGTNLVVRQSTGPRRA